MIFVFSDCELDLDRFELRRAGRLRPVEPQVFDLLAVLIRERHRVVPKEELLDTVWGSRSAPATVHTAVKGIAQACVPQPDEMLYDLLAAAIGEYAAWSGRDARRSTRRNTAMVAIAP